MSIQRRVWALTLTIVLGIGAAAWAGGPTPAERQDAFSSTCAGGPNQGGTCTAANESVMCPGSACVVTPQSKTFRGVLTIIMDEGLGDWYGSAACGFFSVPAQAATVLLEVKKDGVKHLFASTYQNGACESPQLEPTVLRDPFTEYGVSHPDFSLIRFTQPVRDMADKLRALYGFSGTPVIVSVSRTPVIEDQQGSSLATVLRFKVKFQFI